MEFKYRLPSMNIEGRNNGNYNNPEMEYPCMLSTTDHELGDFMALLRTSVREERRLIFIDHKVLMACLNWIRDHVHMMKSFCHWEYDLKSFMDFILDNQVPQGYFFELIKQLDDSHWQFVDPDCYRIYEADNLAAVRLEIEADIEYLMVEGAIRVYKATGDDEWMRSALPKLEKGIEYMMSSDKRWDAKRGLVKRAFTIDTWDFAYGQPNENRRLEEYTPMSIMHGDNSGVYAACMSLAWLNERSGNIERAEYWRLKAYDLKTAMFKYLWNGKYFIHMLHIDHLGADDLENTRLSLSNTYDMNRGVTDLSESGSIITEYMNRRGQNGHFAEWYSIDPPYAGFNGIGPNSYINGCISPFTAGELAKAALNNGYEEYGYDILKRLMVMAKKDKNIYFLYSNDTASPRGGGPSGWGAASILSAIDEALAGVVDTDVLYRKISFSPRWATTPYTDLRYITGYEVSNRTVDIRYMRSDEGMLIEAVSCAREIDCHILLPVGVDLESIKVDGQSIPFKLSAVRDSMYADFGIINKEERNSNRIECLFRNK